MVGSSGDLTTTIDEHEAHTGGKLRYTQVGKEGKQFRFHGSFDEATAPERTVPTFEYDDLPERGHVLLERIAFDEKGSVTTLTMFNSFLSVEGRDAMFGMDMESGLRESFERLEKLL